MMIKFTKMVAAGNDFVIIDNRKIQTTGIKLSLLAKQACDRKYGIGADGLLILEKTAKADIRMRIFNPDGSEPNMCGNGIRCVALYCFKLGKLGHRVGGEISVKIQTKAGMLTAKTNKARVKAKIKMTRPKNLKLDLPIQVAKRKIRVNFLNTGVPHAVVFVEGIDKIDVDNIGRAIRFHKAFMPQGTNVNFVEIIDGKNIKLRTYERGVESETLACGTGTVASALIVGSKMTGAGHNAINVCTRSGEILKVEFNKSTSIFNDVWLQGESRIVYAGVYYV